MSVIVECKVYSPGEFPSGPTSETEGFRFFKLRGALKYSYAHSAETPYYDPLSRGYVEIAVRVVTKNWETEIPYYELRDEDTGKLLRSGRIPPYKTPKLG